jgi:ribonuclease VapC
LIVVDSSAIVAILTREPLAQALSNRISSEDSCLISAANYVETGQVLAQRSPRAPRNAIADLDEFMRGTDIFIEPIDVTQALIALEARIKYGRGFGHPAGLNYSDCFAYALAKARNLPLLFIGNDFPHTDIAPALT